MEYVAYYRVSTDKQGISGLGLEAQQQSVKCYLKGSVPIAEYIEIESSAKRRPKLQEALALCKKNKAMLIIAKLDRLARNVHFVSGLLESGVEFVAVDNPHATKLMIHMLAVFAEHEREQISIRTKDALKAAKARGVILGKHGKILAATKKRDSISFAKGLQPVLNEIMDRDIVTYRGIADELNRLQVPTFTKAGKWYGPGVFNVFKKLG